MNKRLIGSFEGEEKGPLMICIAGMHGNEPAGVQALESIFYLLEMEPALNPSFKFKGRIVGLRGNLRALERKVRYLKRDLNRQWKHLTLERVLKTRKEELEAEDLELRELYDAILSEINSSPTEDVILLDLHTTGAEGGIFSIPAENSRSLDLAVHLNAPVVKGMFQGIKGTLLKFFVQHLKDEVSLRAVAFEAGQHEDILSVNRTIAAVINCMRSIGCVRAEHVENRHDKLLIDFSSGLPKVSDLICRYGVRPEDEFRMLPGYANFQEVKEGELLAYDRNGPIHSPIDGLILMPLYQKQGEDGFFIIRPAAVRV
jgi:succinylglutamate desuccinylase